MLSVLKTVLYIHNYPNYGRNCLKDQNSWRFLLNVCRLSKCSTDWLTIPCATNTNDPNAQEGTPVVCVDRNKQDCFRCESIFITDIIKS